VYYVISKTLIPFAILKTRRLFVCWFLPMDSLIIW